MKTALIEQHTASDKKIARIEALIAEAQEQA